MTEQNADFVVKHSERFLDGSSLTWDGEAKAGYLHIDPNPDAFAVARTVDIGEGIWIDLADDGRVRGVESIGREVDEWTLLKVLRWCCFNNRPVTHIDGVEDAPDDCGACAHGYVPGSNDPTRIDGKV